MNSESELPHFKAIFLIIASKGPAYNFFKRELSRYLTKYERNRSVKFFFLYGKNSAPKTRDRNDLIFNIKDSWKSGITFKTFKAFDYILKRYKFDFCIRTNLSCLFIIPTFLNYLEKIPTTNCYHGIIYPTGKVYSKKKLIARTKFVSGAGMILSPDVVRILSKIDIRKNKYLYINTSDDVIIGYLLSKRNILPSHNKEYIRLYLKNKDEQNLIRDSRKHFHIRLKSSNRMTDLKKMRKIINSVI